MDGAAEWRVADSSGDKPLEFADYDTPYLKVHAVLDFQRRIKQVFGDQGDPAGMVMESLDQALAIHEGNHDMAMLRADALVDNQDVAIEYLGTLHAVALDRKEEGRDRIAHQVFVDVESLVLIVGGRRGKPAETLTPSSGSASRGASSNGMKTPMR